jgi:hypothetical protein
MKAFTWSLQAPLPLHVTPMHSSTLVSQMLPVKPGTHAQLYVSYITDALFVESVHVAPFMHGEERHSSMSVQLTPEFCEVNPAMHVQT